MKRAFFEGVSHFLEETERDTARRARMLSRFDNMLFVKSWDQVLGGSGGAA